MKPEVCSRYAMLHYQLHGLLEILVRVLQCFVEPGIDLLEKKTGEEEPVLDN